MTMPQEQRLSFVTPTPALLDDYIEGCREMWGHVHNHYIIHDPNRIEQWQNRIFTDFANQERGIGLPQGFVPSKTLWLTLNGHYAGTANIRLRLSPQLEAYGGHAGIVIRTSLRGQGLGTAAFPQVIAHAHQLGIRSVLATCEAGNLASRKMLQRAQPSRSQEKRIILDGQEHDVCYFWYDD